LNCIATRVNMPFGRLEITVVEAKNLKGGSFMDKADPYISLSTDRQNTQKTTVSKDAGANATWNQNFYFDIVEGRNELYVQAYDEDPGSDDLIGGAVVQLGPLFQSGFADAWFPLTKQDRNTGNVHLVMKFHGQGPTSGPTGYAPYPVSSGGQGGYSTPPTHHGPTEYSSLGPQGGPMPTGYGAGTPPPPGQPGYPPAQPAGYYQQPPQQPFGAPQQTGYPPQSASYGSQPAYPGSAPPSQSSGYSGQPGAVYPGSVTSPPSSDKAQKEGGSDWVKTAGIGVAALAGAGALAYVGKKMYDEHEEKEFEKHHKQEGMHHSQQGYE
ncbi:1274_t:CDS:2, partial [Acaulospora morrowiae]